MKVEVKYILPEETIDKMKIFTKQNKKNLNFMVNKFLINGIKKEENSK